MNLTEFQSKVQKLEASLAHHEVTTVFCEEGILCSNSVDWEVAKIIVNAYLERRANTAEPKRYSWMNESSWNSVKAAGERNKVEAAKNLEIIQSLTDEQWAKFEIPGYAKCWEIAEAVLAQVSHD